MILFDCCMVFEDVKGNLIDTLEGLNVLRDREREINKGTC